MISCVRYIYPICFTVLNVVNITVPQNPKNVANVLIIVNIYKYICYSVPEYQTHLIITIVYVNIVKNTLILYNLLCFFDINQYFNSNVCVYRIANISSIVLIR